MEHRFVLSSIADDIRVDGRSRLSQRDFSIKLNVNSQARGSSQVWLGETCVVCFVYSDVTDREDDAASRYGMSISAKVISVSDDVATSTVRSLAADLNMLYKTMPSHPVIRTITSRMISCSGGGSNNKEEDSTTANTTSTNSQTTKGHGVGVKVVAEISVLSGSGGNVLSAAAIAVKSALWNTSIPYVHVVLGSDGVSASSVEVDEQRLESIASVGFAMPLVVKALATGTGFYCVDPCKEEEVAAAYETVVGVQLPSTNNSSNKEKNTADQDSSSSSSSIQKDSSSASSSSSAVQIVYSRIHSSSSAAVKAAARSDSNVTTDNKNKNNIAAPFCELSVNDVTAILSECSSAAERLHELWTSKVS